MAKDTDKQAAQKLMAEEALRQKQGPFGEGDLVRLKSGGPAMTVTIKPSALPNNVREGDLLCMYFDGQQIKTFYFGQKVLIGAPEIGG